MNQTSVDYPKLKLGGIEYTVRFTRGAFAYHMSKNSLNFSDLKSALKVHGTLVDMLGFALQPAFPGSPEELSEVLIEEKKGVEAVTAVLQAVGKAFPTPITSPAAAGAEDKAQLQ